MALRFDGDTRGFALSTRLKHDRATCNKFDEQLLTNITKIITVTTHEMHQIQFRSGSGIPTGITALKVSGL